MLTTAASRPRRANPQRATPSPSHRAEAKSASHWLSSARSHLAAGNVAPARSDIDRALEVASARPDKAEAFSLRAECALVAGNRLEAARRYLEVARRYRDLDAGETALFAAARLEANAGQVVSARTHLRQYLSQYPDGRFRDEATQRLELLE